MYDRIERAPLNFEDPDGLARAMEGAEVLYNTYWIRFAFGNVTHEAAVAARARRQVQVRDGLVVSDTRGPLPDRAPRARGPAPVAPR